jgi:hypothetical protein
MIWTTLLDFFVGILYGLVSKLPGADENVVTLISNFAIHFRTYFQAISYVFPTNYFFTMLGFLFVIELEIFLIHMAVWLLVKLHLLG